MLMFEVRLISSYIELVRFLLAPSLACPQSKMSALLTNFCFEPRQSTIFYDKHPRHKPRCLLLNPRRESSEYPLSMRRLGRSVECKYSGGLLAGTCCRKPAPEWPTNAVSSSIRPERLPHLHRCESICVLREDAWGFEVEGFVVFSSKCSAALHIQVLACVKWSERMMNTCAHTSWTYV